MPKPPTPLTLPVARKAVRWFQRTMGIQDWAVKLVVTDEPPADLAKVAEDGVLGLCSRWVPAKTATVWVSNTRCEADGECPLETLFHEMMHIVAVDTGLTNDTSHHTEFVWNRLAVMFSIAYRAAQKPPKEFGSG